MVLERETRCFRARLPDLLSTAEGKYALIRSDRVVGLFDTEEEAVNVGFARCGSSS